MVYVQKDLSTVTKAVFDNWAARKGELNHRYMYVANARVTPREILASVKKRESDPTPLSLPFSLPFSLAFLLAQALL